MAGQLTKTSVVWPSAVSGSSYSDNNLSWVNTAGTLYSQLDYSTNGTTWITIDSEVPGSSYMHTINVLNATIYYRVRNFSGSRVWGAWSSTLSFAIYVDTEAETMTATESYTEGGTWTGGGPTAATDTMAETMTATDTWIDAVISKTNIAYFLGSATGLVYRYGTSYHGDNGTAIASRWESKEIDFFDLYPQFDGKWKVVDRIWIRYVDKDTITLNVSLSVDNGATWETVSRSLGTGTGYVKEANFDFRKTGRFFKVRIEESSSTVDFQITDMYVEFYPAGDHFSLT